MKKLIVVLLLAVAVGMSGCTYPRGVVMAPIMLDQIGPEAAFDNNVGSSKVGRAQAQGIILVGSGDASIAAAARNGGITKIHHVDSETFNVLGIYSRYETIVYGQ